MKPISLPEATLNELAQQAAQRLMAAHPFEKGFLSGEELKAFAPHKQINKFLIFQVFQAWEMQLSKLAHPYFNLDHPDIQGNLQTLKNQISQHIEVSEADFKPMLERAIYNNLKLVLDPEEAFSSFFFVNEDSVSLDLYQRYSQFFSDLDFVVNSILRYYQKNQFETVEKTVFFQKMEKVVDIFNKKSDQDFETYRREIFHQITDRKLDEVMAEAQAQELEIQRQSEAEAQRKAEAEEAQRKAEEAQRKAEEEARLKAEAEAEEARRKEEEEERLRQEEEARKQAEKKTSFFDTLDQEDAFFDLDLDDSAQSPVETVTEPEPEAQPEELPQSTWRLDPEIEAAPQEEVAPEADAETQTETEVVADQAEFLEMAASMEPATETDSPAEEETPVAETIPEPEMPPQAEVEPAPEPEPEPEPEAEPMPQAEATPAPEPEPVPEPQAEAPVVEEPVAENSAESTFSYLEKFISKSEVNNGSQEPVETPEAPASVFESAPERPKTIADQFTEKAQETETHHDRFNGNQKIKLDEIPIHKQYQYVQKVFDGNNVRFRIIVDKVNNAQDKAEVEGILEKFVLNNEELDRSDAVVTEFITMLRNRF